MADEQKLEHAQEFTDIERQTLRVWFDVDQAGNDMLADAVLNAGLQFEHYTSLLPDDTDDRSPGQLANQQHLAFLLSVQLNLAAAFLLSAGSSRADNVRGFERSIRTALGLDPGIQ